MQKSRLTKPKRAVAVSDVFSDDLRYWAENDWKLLLRLLDLMDGAVRDPFDGVGKPEPLKHKAAGSRSRRIAKERRVLYVGQDDRIEFLRAR